MNAVQYLLQLKGKPGYLSEYNRLKQYLCEADVEELEEKDLQEAAPKQQIFWFPFSIPTRNKILVVKPDLDKARTVWDFKLVHWDGTTLTEECGKMYSWEHNPYLEWCGVA